MDHYDVIIIGAGQAGGPLSSAFARAGKKTAIIEREHIGGTCINEGCTPTKTMIASGRVAYLARRGSDYGVQTGPVSIDMKKIRQRKRDIVESFRGGSEKRIDETEGLDRIDGEAHFTGNKTIEVNGRTLTADIIVIDTGARPSIPPVLVDVNPLTSTTVMELDEVPDHLIVIGGSYVALEFSQLFRRLGSKVTVIERGPRLVGREDEDISDAVRSILEEDGLSIITGGDVVSARRNDGGVEVTITTGGESQTVRGSHILAAAGRTPNTDALNPAATDVKLNDHGFIPVNERLETNVAGIYAVGDVNGGPAFTHISYDDFRILKTNLIDGGDITTRGRQVPYTMYIDPQLSHVGLYEREAKAKGLNYQVASMPMSHVARALETDESRGLMKAIVDSDSGQILGATVLGLEGGEILAMLQIAMFGNLPYTTLRDGVFAHPTLAESLNNLFSAIE